ncbi:sodium-dependent transporter, partial [Methanobrevibacter sp. OttesenSCG-928-K11]|nr:sodium-dependent transporter [Methanobrevibacter sp. OttesenSCG-928-K11]
MPKTSNPEWDSSFAFLMAMIGSAVGLGNIWRFPYTLYSNGGGSFLIPYIIAIVVLGLPMLLLEYSVGYKFKTSLSNILHKIKPKFEYIGWFITLTIFLITSYYISIVGWDLIYFFLSFFKGWGADPNLFFVNSLLQQNNSLNGLFSVSPILIISTFAIWIVTWFICSKNINNGISKISKCLVPALFGMIVIIVFYSITLPGANIGYVAMFTPDWHVLSNLDIWIVAFGQILFSLSIGMGIIITYSSYLPKGSNLFNNAVTVIGANCGFEIFNAIGIFSILGFMSHVSGVGVNNLITEGTGLAFIAFPQVFNVMGDVAYILGPMFFLCILFAGITSLIALIEAIRYSISEKFNLSRKKATTIVCSIGFLISIIFTTGMGSYILGVFDGFLNNFALLLGVLFECIIFAWFYSVDDLIKCL